MFVWWWWWSGGVGRRRFEHDGHERRYGSDGSELSELTFEALGTIAEKKRHTPKWTDEQNEKDEKVKNETMRKNDL